VKVAFTTSGKDLTAPLDARFGRAPGFLIYDIDSDAAESATTAAGGQYIDNQQSLDAAQGAGIQAAETVVRSGAQVVVTGHCGPKAFRVLSAAGVKVYNTDQPTVAAALAAYKAGTLKPAESADVEGHWV
jgi:predicted Fe-Mo cluster-binding NifX family protein